MKAYQPQRIICYLMMLIMVMIMAGCGPTPVAKTAASPMSNSAPAMPAVGKTIGSGVTNQSTTLTSAVGTPAPMTPGVIPLASSAPSVAATAAAVAENSLVSTPTTGTPVPEITPTPTPPVLPSLSPKFFYFSYDDSASTVGAELTKNALKNNQMPNSSWARTYEFFNYEKFDTANQEKIGMFNVSMGLWKHSSLKNKEKTLYDLGAYISSPTIDMAARKNLVLTLLVDISGSMDEPSASGSYEIAAGSKLELVKYGLTTLFDSLKPGDVVNICTFESYANTVLENYQYDPTDKKYIVAVANLKTSGSTNLNEGIDEAYKIASKYYDSNKTNRVVILTDANANTGEVSPEKISTKTKINNLEGIYFSGIGVGQDFNESFLNKLTEAGKGAYFSIVSKTDAKRTFNDRFIALLNVAAREVQFRIDYPEGMNHTTSAAEQLSTVQSEVTPTNFSFNTSQFFLEGFEELNSTGLADQTIKLTVMYKNPETGEKVTEVYEKKVSDLLDKNIGNIKDAYTIQLLTKLIKGDLPSDDAKNILALFEGYSSPLYNEYKNLINTWINLPKSGYNYISSSYHPVMNY